MKTNNNKYPITKTKAEWKEILSEIEYEILREKGTERAFTGEYNDHKEIGTYTCKGCSTELFRDVMKFDSHCGWPSFDSEIESAKIEKVADKSFGMTRTEILCSTCGSHLGHLFTDGPTDTGYRYCVNSASLNFEKS
jgi:peptide-methionine (R)-S-oxide reductase